jgi:dihydropteroate synthase
MNPLTVANHTFIWGARTYVMGILNVTPDSFSGDGIIAKGDAVQVSIEQAHGFVASNVDVLDVGGESTRPGSAPVTVDEELQRVIPVIRALKENFPDT